ncbi:hypothetical protein D5S19_18580 [Amycolatopsis panacis]|uniref:Transposase n=1 Tax=Amycolatopsis panacis TaxID=2340917 RepID=A0A419I2A1_9PSEU|nr:hypothetical protein D5S19_18580 [Amycolatopsis panacis]
MCSGIRISSSGEWGSISSIRSAVERCIAHVENWKMLATGYRGRLSELPKVTRIITSLEFYPTRPAMSTNNAP